MAATSIEAMRDRVLTWERAIRDDSNLYSRLALAATESDDVLELLCQVPPGQLEMNMLLGAVQYLLIRDRTHRLAEWYPSLGGTRTGGELPAQFVDFVGTNRSAVLEIVTTRRVQTNEVARCTFLLPAYNLVGHLTGLPLALIEVGTSAGLNQNVDRYGYRYTSRDGEVTLGTDAALTLECDTGDNLPRPVDSLPEIEWRTGLDLDPVDVTDVDQARWLRALVWPDQVERHERLGMAIALAQIYPPSVVAGDAFLALPNLVEQAPRGTALVVQHSFVLNQFERSSRERFYSLLDGLATERPIYRVSAEWLVEERGTELALTIHGSKRTEIELATVHHHGMWIRWSS